MPELMTKQDAIETLENFRDDYTREGSQMCRAIDIVLGALKQPTIEPEVRLIPKEVSATDIDKLTEMIKASLLQAYPNDVSFTAVRHGRWIVRGQEIYCSECNMESLYNPFGASKFSYFCPNCGARMDGGAR